MAARTRLLFGALLIAYLLIGALAQDDDAEDTTTFEEDDDKDPCCSDGESMVLDNCEPSPDQFDDEKCKETALKCCNEKTKSMAVECDKGIEHAKKHKKCDGLEDNEAKCCNDCNVGYNIGNVGTCEGFKNAALICCKISFEEKTATTPKASVSTPETLPKPNSASADQDACDLEGDSTCAHKCIPNGDSYKCQCRTGFKLLSDGQSCQKIESDKCQKKNPCQHKCSDNGESIICSCRPGFELMADSFSCIDIDECEMDTHTCNQNRKCKNTVGSYRCVENTAAKKMSCPKGYRANKENQVCDDIDECLEKPCPAGRICVNTIGSFSCSSGAVSHFPPQSSIDPEASPIEEICPSGYRLHPEREDCVDIDECKENTDDCNKHSQICLNMPGKFTCQNKASKTTCPAGYKMVPEKGCIDIDECVEYSDICSKETVCINVPGGYDCKEINSDDKAVPTLPKPAIPNSITPKPTISRPLTVKNITVSCPGGFRRSYNGGCVDINECLEKSHSCDEHQECQNTLGSHRCNCRRGFKKDPVTLGCIDINECQHSQMNTCNIGQRCDNTIGSYQCIRYSSCGTGYTLNAGSGICEDDDECELNTHNCNQHGAMYECVNIRGSFKCVKKIVRTTTTPEPEYYYYYDGEDDNNTNSNEPATNTSTASAPIYNPPPLPTLPPIPTDPPQLPDPPVPITPLTPFQSTAPNSNQQHPERTVFPPDSPNAEHYTPVQQNPSQMPKITQIPIPHDPKTKTYVVPLDKNGNIILDTKTLPENSITHFIPTQSRAEYCPPGFFSDSRGKCNDIDECATGKYICTPYSEICKNTEGSYRCVCAPGYYKEDSSGVCKIIRHAPRVPTAPRWSPTPIKNCDIGYHLDPSTEQCVDTNECEDGTPRCASGEECRNTLGGFKCQCKQGLRLIQGRCVPQDWTPVFTPPSRTSQRTSTPVRVVTVTKPPQYRYCPDGYRLSGERCVDRNECEEGAHSCPRDQLCVNIDGGYMCRCPPGHLLTKSGCDDIDECAETGGKVCSHYSRCVNTIGSYKCDCNRGYVQSQTSQHLCMDVNECEPNNGKGPCHHNCINVWGSYRCACERGYKLYHDNRTCIDIDECATGFSRLCVGECHNTQGGFECRCPKGYTVGRDKKTCIDVDECENGELTCGLNEICHNTRGGARCSSVACPPGYNREPNSKHRCRKAIGCRVTDRVCMSKPDTLSFNFITFASNLPIPTSPVQQVDLFTMRGPNKNNAMLRFELRLIYVKAPNGVKKATEHDFKLSPSAYHAGVSLVKSLSGPQDILLELSMELYTNGRFDGSAVAQLFVFVSQYDF